MQAHTLPVSIIHRTHAIFFFRSISHACTHTHTSPSPSYRAFFISHMHAQWSMFLYVCVYIAMSFIVFHINRLIYISSEVSPSFPRPHRSIYTSLYRITCIANTPTLIIYPTTPLIINAFRFISQTRAQWRRQGQQGPCPPNITIYRG